MSDDVSSEGPTATGVDGGEVATPQSFAELLTRVIRDGGIGAVAGAAGDVAILGTLYLATLLDVLSPAPFARTPELLGLGAVFSESQLLLVGIGLFILGGMIVWPLVLSTLGLYLPGDTSAAKGLVFGGIIWTGFVTFFYTGVTGTGLALYLVLTLLGHLGYGFVTGAMLDRLFGNDTPLVSFAFTRGSRVERSPTGGPSAPTPDAEVDAAGGGADADPATATDPDPAARPDTVGGLTRREIEADPERALSELDETALSVPPLLRFEKALRKIATELDDPPAEYRTVVGNYVSLARENSTPPAHVSDLRGYVLSLKDALPGDRAVQRWVDSMTTRLDQYLDTHNTAETLHLADVTFYEDDQPVEAVADLSGDLATVEVTVLNQGDASGAVVRLEFRREGEQAPDEAGEPEQILLRTDDLSMGVIDPGERKTMSTQVYVPSIAEWCDAKAMTPRDDQTFLTDVDEVRRN